MKRAALLHIQRQHAQLPGGSVKLGGRRSFYSLARHPYNLAQESGTVSVTVTVTPVRF
jgi:hypothetical protein